MLQFIIDQLPQTVEQLNTRIIKVRAVIAIELLRIRNVIKRNCLVQLELPIYFMATNWNKKQQPAISQQFVATKIAAHSAATNRTQGMQKKKREGKNESETGRQDIASERGQSAMASTRGRAKLLAGNVVASSARVCVCVCVCKFAALLTVDLHSNCTKGNPKSEH